MSWKSQYNHDSVGRQSEYISHTDTNTCIALTSRSFKDQKRHQQTNQQQKEIKTQNILITFFVFNNVPVYFLGHDFLLDFTLLPILELRIWVWNLYFYIVRAKIQSCLFKSISKYCSNTLIRSVAIKFILNLRIN